MKSKKVEKELHAPVLELGRVLQKLQPRVREQHPGQESFQPVGRHDVVGTRGSRRGGARRRRRRAAARSAPGSGAAASALAPQNVEHSGLGACREPAVRLDPRAQGGRGHRGPSAPGGDEASEQRVRKRRREVEDVAHQVFEHRDRQSTVRSVAVHTRRAAAGYSREQGLERLGAGREDLRRWRWRPAGEEEARDRGGGGGGGSGDGREAPLGRERLRVSRRSHHHRVAFTSRGQITSSFAAARRRRPRCRCCRRCCCSASATRRLPRRAGRRPKRRRRRLGRTAPRSRPAPLQRRQGRRRREESSSRLRAHR